MTTKAKVIKKIGSSITKDHVLFEFEESYYHFEKGDFELEYNRYSPSRARHLYFIDENAKIETNDWIYSTESQSVFQNTENYKCTFPKECVKIIATTDPKLELPLISKSFLRIYVKNRGVIEYVELYTNLKCKNHLSVDCDEICDCSETLPYLVLRNDCVVVMDYSPLLPKKVYVNESIEFGVFLLKNCQTMSGSDKKWIYQRGYKTTEEMFQIFKNK